MKTLLNNLAQTKKYGPSRGVCVIELDSTDNVNEIIKKYTAPCHELAVHYFNPRRLESFNDFKGDLLVFDMFQEYLD